MGVRGRELAIIIFFFLLVLSQNLVAKHQLFIAVSALVIVSIARCWHVSRRNVCSKADTASCMREVKGFVYVFEKSNYTIVQEERSLSQNAASQAQPL